MFIENLGLNSGKSSYNFKSGAKSISFNGMPHINSVGKSFKNNIQIVFSDIDGTISKHSDMMSKKTIDTVDFLHENNVPVVLTTARCYQDTLPILRQFSHRPDYTIVLQGGGLVNGSGNSLFENTISARAGKKLVKWFKSIRQNDKNSHLIMYFDEQPYSMSGIQFPWKSYSPVKQVNSFDDLFESKKQLQKAIIYKYDAARCPDYNQSDVINSFKGAHIRDLDIKPSGLSVLEFQNKWVSKDKAIDFLLRALKLEPKNAMVIGDSANDIEMMDFIRKQNGLAVAMGNADDFVKSHANAITSHIDEDGFSTAVGKIFDTLI